MHHRPSLSLFLRNVILRTVVSRNLKHWRWRIRVFISTPVLVSHLGGQIMNSVRFHTWADSLWTLWFHAWADNSWTLWFHAYAHPLWWWAKSYHFPFERSNGNRMFFNPGPRMHDLKLAFITRPTKVDNPKQSKGEKNTHTQDWILIMWLSQL